VIGATILDFGLKISQSAIPNGERYAESKDEEYSGEADANDRGRENKEAAGLWSAHFDKEVF
jgi:hypothetical protein